MFNKLKQIKDIRQQAKGLQSQLAEVMIVGKGAGGKIMVTVDGNQSVQGVKIDEGMSTPDIEKGIKEAFNDATKKLQKELAVKMKDMGGLDALKGMLS
ncbi:MAG: YbaB/EbfC family nucleoid-associated protein [Patescibacteria group bacterium]|nr:YbaB/EbfC family nucleoid-associated protein [Patescibacteria group bacterium]